MRTKLLHLCLVFAAVLTAVAPGHARTKVSQESRSADWPTSHPSVVFIADFELERDAREPEKQRRLGDGRLGHRLRAEPADPAAADAQLVEALATGIVDHLAKAGIPAQRLDPSTTRPQSGWLVRGVFVEVDEGNRLRRAAIGFGSGKTELQLIVAVSDLAAGGEAPIYTFGTEKGSGKLPGAVLTLNPYVAGAKFLFNRNSLQKDAKAAAAKIAAQIAEAAKKTGTGTSQ